MTVGDRIKTRRIELNLSQDELAKKVGYKSRSSIQKIECARKLPLDKVELMASALECSISYLMDWEDEDGIKTPHGELNDIYARNLAIQASDRELLDLYHNMLPEAQDSVVQLIKSLQRKSDLPHLKNDKPQ